MSLIPPSPIFSLFLPQFFISNIRIPKNKGKKKKVSVMSMQKLLDIDPQQVAFRLEVGRQVSCRIKISNNSQGHVAFKVMTTNVHKYFSRPNAGVLSPGECLEITATMQALTEIPSNMECNDEFLIRRVVATPLHTAETAHELFSDGTRAFEDCRLEVVYDSLDVLALQLVRIGLGLLMNIVLLYLIFLLLGIKTAKHMEFEILDDSVDI
ncbi:hypothetical protein ACP275_01G098200 [Erythranthe tilingii]